MLIGHSHLEFGDAPMGVAFGSFIPNDLYASVKPEIVGSWGNQEHLELTASTPNGLPIKCLAVAINDRTADISPEALFVEILGIPYPDYAEIFPEHVKAYQKLYPE